VLPGQCRRTFRRRIRTRDGHEVELIREIATLVATGLSTKALADRLFLSPWTVQDHLKTIFEKTGTHNRWELRAQIFFDEFLPGIDARTPLAADGALTSPAVRR
jgi:hypothetical protein